MQDTPTTTQAIPDEAATTASRSALTPLAQALGAAPGALAELAGVLSYPVFSVTSEETRALLEGAGAFDLGYRGQLAVGGADCLRWLNGMLTNNIQGLAPGSGSYSFVLNAQGRIQGDCDAYRMPEHLLVITDRSQIPALMAHFDHFIIMDDVALEDVSPTRTCLGLAGPLAAQLLGALGVALPADHSGALWLLETRICGVPVQLTGGYPTAAPRFELWCANERAQMLWTVLLAAGAIPCGLRAAETLRVLEAIPRFGVDLQERDLPQETGQARALHFAKGCYLGQEIVERIRSRGNVHRRMVQLSLTAHPAELPAELLANGHAAGRITSAATWRGTHYGLGIVRSEAAERHPQLDYAGGSATLLAQPALPRIGSAAAPVAAAPPATHSAS
jgi:folate-binding protein YgfZ